MDIRQRLKEWMGPVPEHPGLMNAAINDPSPKGEMIKLGMSLYPPAALAMSADSFSKKEWEEAMWYLMDAGLMKLGTKGAQFVKNRLGGRSTKQLVNEVRQSTSTVERYKVNDN